MHRHAYHQSLVYKIWNARKPDVVVNTFAQTLELIRQVHQLTAGVPQIVYLVGWQYDGHDSKYPDFSAVNRRLKRDEDADAADSLRWLMAEAKAFNATVSLHINLCDAYESSPLWAEYVAADLLTREADGSLKKGGVWGGEQSYLVCKTREWQSGHTKRRIDRLLKLLPISEAGTIHIDVFQPLASPYHGVTVEQEFETMRQIVDYWNAAEVDVTKEWHHHELVDKVPMAWHSNFDEASRLRIRPGVACGGGSAWNMRRDHADRPGGFSKMPEPGCLYEEAWGHSIDGDISRASDLARDFYRKTLPFIFLNRHRALRHAQTVKGYRVDFSDGVSTTVETTNGYRFLLARRAQFLVDGGLSLLPASWRGDDSYIAHSELGGSHRFALLPPEWERAKQVRVRALWPLGNEERVVAIDQQTNTLSLDLAAEAAALVRPC